MRCSIILILMAAGFAYAPVNARAQVRSFAPHPCPSGQVPAPMRQPDGTVKWQCAAAPLVPHDEPGVYQAPPCSQNSDCPKGPDRCIGGYCQRGGMGCKSDIDCKYSEFCDLSHPVLLPQLPGMCAPKGGHY